MLHSPTRSLGCFLYTRETTLLGIFNFFFQIDSFIYLFIYIQNSFISRLLLHGFYGKWSERKRLHGHSENFLQPAWNHVVSNFIYKSLWRIAGSKLPGSVVSRQRSMKVQCDLILHVWGVVLSVEMLQKYYVKPISQGLIARICTGLLCPPSKQQVIPNQPPLIKQ